MTHTSASTHDAKAIKFRTGAHTNDSEGGWISIVAETGTNAHGSTDPCEFIIHTWDSKLFDHFCDIARVANGPVGSLRPEPDPQETT